MSPACLNCGKDGKTMVQLTCEHDLCLQCAQSIKIAEGKGPLDSKFRICCPTCRKNTITLNIQNLVNNDKEKLLFVNMESSQLSEEELQQQFGGQKGRISESKLRKMSYTQRRSSVYAERRTPEVFDRSNKIHHQSRASNRSRAADILEVKCSTHKESLMFYCQQESIVMCMQCMYKHMKQQKNHNVCSLSDALPTITKVNLEYKTEAKQRMEDIDRNLMICKGNKSRIEQAYDIHEQMIAQEFRQLEKLIKKKEQENRQHLERVFKKKEEQIGEQINELNYIKNCLKEHYEFNIDNSSSQVYFFNAFNMLKSAVSKYTLSYKQIKKEEFFCFDKFASLEDFLALLERFYKPREGGRESKATAARKDDSNGPSRASEKGNSLKIKEQFYAEAKKKLEKLNKMEHEHNNVKKKNSREQYLQNFFIEEMGRELEHSYRPPGSAVVSYRKSSASEYVERKGAQKTQTPTRVTPTPTHSKVKKGK